MDIKGNALFKNGFKAGLGTNIALGLGLIMLGPTVASLAGRVLRSTGKAIVKGGLIVYQEARKIASEAGEAVQEPALDTPSARSTRQAETPNQIQPSSSTAEARVGAAPSASAPQDTDSIQKERTGPWIVRGY